MEFMYLIILLVILAIFSVTCVNLDATGNMYCFELRCCMRTPQNLHLCHQTHICNPQGLDALVILMSTVFFLRMSALIQFFQGEIDRMEQEWGIFQNIILCQKYASNIIDRKNQSGLDFVSNQSGMNCAPEFKFRKNDKSWLRIQIQVVSNGLPKGLLQIYSNRKKKSKRHT